MTKILVALALGLLGVFGVSLGEELGGYEPADVPTYGNCPNPETYCANAHPGSSATAGGVYEQCFEMMYATEARLVAADGQGLFPRTFMAWHTGTLVPAGSIPCEIEKSGNKTKISIPAGATRCRVDLHVAERVYHWHFASNPVNNCLAWLQCAYP